MDMKNVGKLVALFAFMEGVDFDTSKIIAAGEEVFGSETLFGNACKEILSNWNNLSNDQVDDLFVALFKETYIVIKQDLEADALRDKENAS